MKKLIEQVEGEGLESLLGEDVTIWCCRYIYAGKLTGVNEKDILLTNAKIVYETGEFSSSGFNDSQDLPNDWYVRIESIESYGKMS
ncbi:MAG: hypothetical protein GY861_16455 [bacterium]|nr:hypothetical protein [bacterium]